MSNRWRVHAVSAGSCWVRQRKRIVSQALIRLARSELEFTENPIGDLPLYSPDFDSDYPPGGSFSRSSGCTPSACSRSCPGG
jgi:hypothetical protein